ncbi:MAG: hypothetical protein JEZ00_18375 [Anaerolineaceae bacterium]|nr:hypothetical protein [Anaerolineaceae bacterium]
MKLWLISQERLCSGHTLWAGLYHIVRIGTGYQTRPYNCVLPITRPLRQSKKKFNWRRQTVKSWAFSRE